jgi:hypothetical protein
MSRRKLCYFKSLVSLQRDGVLFELTFIRSDAKAVEVLRRKSLAPADQSFGLLSLSVSPILNLGKTVFHGSAMSSMSRPSDHRSWEPDMIDISDGLHSWMCPGRLALGLKAFIVHTEFCNSTTCEENVWGRDISMLQPL